MQENTISEVRQFYNQDPMLEWGRLDRHPFEEIITRHYLERYIKPGDRVLDLGGGPGRYSLWLAARGVETVLVDLSDANVAMAAERAAAEGLTLTALQGDAREIDRLVEGPFDHLLLMGPMYHLLAEEDRVRTLEASLSLLKPGGMLFCAFISNYANLIYLLSHAPDLITGEAEAAWVESVKAGKSYAGPAFTQAYFIQPAEIPALMGRFPLKQRHLFSCEGISAAFQDQLSAMPPAQRDAWLELSIQLAEREELLSWAEHLMYVGEKRSP